MQIHSKESLMRVHGLAPQPTPRRTTLVQAPFDFVWGLLCALIRREIAYRAEIRRYDHLATLSERLLSDIGMTPESVREARHHHVRGKMRDHWL